MAPQVPTETLCVQKVQCMYIICVYMCVHHVHMCVHQRFNQEQEKKIAVLAPCAQCNFDSFRVLCQTIWDSRFSDVCA